MTRLELRVAIAAVLAATVVLGAVACAAYGLAVVAGALAIYALGVGAWLYHCIERYLVAHRISTVRSAAKPFQPLLPVMAAIMGLTQAVVRSLSDVTDLPSRRWDSPVRRWMEITRSRSGPGTTPTSDVDAPPGRSATSRPLIARPGDGRDRLRCCRGETRHAPPRAYGCADPGLLQRISRLGDGD
ncbi:N utilization substance B domain protein [Mycobacterium xenopi 4042]|uniref:N utilization substance B domain protein n=1 Tax=Mycobacterium xenopi 4042 TaxID=1299334 RepID=X7ZYH5_MYCXE|nr:N utilization substance B domain protein [Mycobacterium xenopi 4042]